jgi:hypothetical protein
MELKQETKEISISIAPMRYKAHTKMFKRIRLISSKYVNYLFNFPRQIKQKSLILKIAHFKNIN